MVFLNKLFEKVDLKNNPSMTKTHANYPGGKEIIRYQPQIQNHNTLNYLEIVPLTIAEYVLKRVSFGSKDCTKELKLECAYFLGQTS